MPDQPATQGPSSTDRRPRWGMAVVTGASMSPTLADGDRLLISYARLPVPGAIVVARFPDGTVVVKRAVSMHQGRWWLLSEDPAVGVDSRHRGPVAAEEVVGVALMRLWPRPRSLRVRR